MRIISRIVDWVATPYTIYLILTDPAISVSVKLRAAIGLTLVFAYVISPIDVIPDFIPFAGWLDDIIAVPLGLALVRRFTPGVDVVEKSSRAHSSVKRIVLWTALGLVVFVLLGLLWLAILIYFIVRLVSG